MTPDRIRRLRRALEQRQPDLTVLLENVHKPHNLSAVLRSCDAAGVFEAHAVGPVQEVRISPCYSAGCGRWVKLHPYEEIKSAAETLRGQGLRLLAAHPSPQALDFRQVDLTRPTAILLGQEKDGLSAAALAAADDHVTIPMVGLGTSLNVSVAAALILYEAHRQRLAAGLLDHCRLDPDLFEKTLFEWAYPRVAELCRKRGDPYPHIGDEGELLDPLPR